MKAILVFLTGILVSLYFLHLNPLFPQTKATTTMLRSESESDNIRDSNSLLQLSAMHFCPMAWSYLVLYIHTSDLYNPNTLLNCPCQHSSTSISEGFCMVCVCVCTHALLCHIYSIWNISGWHDINFLPLSPTHKFADMIEMKERHLNTVPSELSFFFLDFQEKPKSSLN